MRPQDLLIGVREFFSILIPGAAFLFFLKQTEIDLSSQALTVAALAAPVAAYLFGAMASGLGSLLDEPVDRLLHSRFLRRKFLTSLERRERLAGAIQAHLVLSCPKGMYPAFPDLPSRQLKAFWWDYLRINCPAAISELDRLEAAQKMGRSFVAVFAALALMTVLSPDRIRLPTDVVWLLSASVVAAAFYISGRYSFLMSAYRLASSYGVTTCR